MAKRRRKNRTHLKGPSRGEDEEEGPRSFVIKSGQVTKSISQLVRDIRQIMEPYTATRLRERPNARLRDYLTVAPMLGVTHMLAFTLTDAANVHLRMARLPQGPTLTFRVQRYSLMKDLVNSSLRGIGKAPGSEYQTPPLLVLNNFSQAPDAPVLPQLRLMSSMFQGLFPPISVEKSALPNFRRVLLISFNPITNLVSVRHYTITVRSHGVSRRVRKLLTTPSLTSRLPSLGHREDIADYLLRRAGTPGSEISEMTGATGSTAGYDTASESEMSEAESDTNAVELPDDYGRGNKKGDRKAVRLVETGPRLEMRLIKVVEGLVGSKKGEGETVFHEFVQKTKGQASALKKSHDERKAARDARRAEQAANVERKKAEKAEKDAKKKKSKVKFGDGDGEDEDENVIGQGDAADEEGILSADDVDLLSDDDLDPEEALARRRERGEAKRLAAKKERKEAKAKAKEESDDEEDDAFDYEDAGFGDDFDEEDEEEDEDEDDWDMDAHAGEVSEEESESESEEERAPPPKRKVKGKK